MRHVYVDSAGIRHHVKTAEHNIQMHLRLGCLNYQIGRRLRFNWVRYDVVNMSDEPITCLGCLAGEANDWLKEHG